MVLKTYQDIDEFYGFIKTAAFGKASSVLILTANEVFLFSHFPLKSDVIVPCITQFQ